MERCNADLLLAPRWLFQHDRHQEATEILRLLRTHKGVLDEDSLVVEITEIMDALALENEQKGWSPGMSAECMPGLEWQHANQLLHDCYLRRFGRFQPRLCSSDVWVPANLVLDCLIRHLVQYRKVRTSTLVHWLCSRNVRCHDCHGCYVSHQHHDFRYRRCCDVICLSSLLYLGIHGRYLGTLFIITLQEPSH